MPRKYVIETGFQTVSAAQDLLEIPNGSGRLLVVREINVVQSSDAAANEAEKLQLRLKRASGSFTSGSGGGTVTPVKFATPDAAWGGGTIERNNTSQASAGTGTLEILRTDLFDVLAGFNLTPIPELCYAVGPSETLILSLESAPADALTLNASIIVEELP